MELNYTQKLLNLIDSGSSLSDHEITLKKGLVLCMVGNTLIVFDSMMRLEPP